MSAKVVKAQLKFTSVKVERTDYGSCQCATIPLETLNMPDGYHHLSLEYSPLFRLSMKTFCVANIEDHKVNWGKNLDFFKWQISSQKSHIFFVEYFHLFFACVVKEENYVKILSIALTYASVGYIRNWNCNNESCRG